MQQADTGWAPAHGADSCAFRPILDFMVAARGLAAPGQARHESCTACREPEPEPEPHSLGRDVWKGVQPSTVSWCTQKRLPSDTQKNALPAVCSEARPCCARSSVSVLPLVGLLKVRLCSSSRGEAKGLPPAGRQGVQQPPAANAATLNATTLYHFMYQEAHLTATWTACCSMHKTVWRLNPISHSWNQLIMLEPDNYWFY